MAPRRDRFAKRRKQLGYSQESFAEANRVATSTVVRWEAGKATPQPHQRPRMARLLQVTPEELDDLLAPVAAIIPDPLPRLDDDEMLRRDFLALIASTGALVTLPAERAAAVAGVDPLNAHLWQVYGMSSSKQAVYPVVRDRLHVVAGRLRDARTAREHQGLLVQVADLYQLAGEIAFDGNRYTEAAQSYVLAASAAKEAGAFDLWACAMTRHAFTDLYEKRFAAAAPLLEAAANIAEKGDDLLSTRYWVAAVQAEAYAGLGDLDGCLRALDRAQGVRDLTGEYQNDGWLRFRGDRLSEERGACMVLLGKPDLAEQALTEALALPMSPRRKGAVLADLAVLGAQRGDRERALHYGGQALDLAQRTGSGWVEKKLAGVMPMLKG